MNSPVLAAPAPAASSPILGADVGTVYTKVYLLESVEGERRLVSVGRAPTRGDDGQPAVGAALAQALEQALGRAGRASSFGAATSVPRLLLTSAAALPGLMLLVPHEAEARALAGMLESLPLRLIERVTLDGIAGDPEALLTRLEAQAPDAIIVAAGTRAADQQLARAALETILHSFGPRAPVLVLAGDEAFVEAGSALLAGAPHRVAPGALGTGALGTGALGTPLLDAIQRIAEERLGQGWFTAEEVGRWVDGSGASSSLAGICAATELIADRYDVDVLSLDLGADHAQAVIATGVRGRRRITSVTRGDLGVRSGRHTVLREAGAASIARWLPLDANETSLQSDARRGLAVPAALPETVDDLLLEHAFAREALRLLVEDLALARSPGAGPIQPLPPVDLLIGSGGVLAGVPRLMQAALIMIDAVQPEALTQLALDRATALPLIGRLSLGDGPAAIGSALERDALLNLGLCVAPAGVGREGEPAIRVEVAATGRSPVTVAVPFGAIEVVPLATGERASLKLWPERELDVGLGRGSAATPRAEVEGGGVGIIIDARGRPLAAPETAEKRQAKLLQWLQSTAAYPQLSFVQARAGE